MPMTARADPLTGKGEEILKSMEKTYGPEKAKQVLYASENKGTISGIHDAVMAMADAVESLNRRIDAYCGRHADAMAEQPAQDIRADDHRVIGGVKLGK